MPLNLVVPEGGQRMQDAVEQLARMVEDARRGAPSAAASTSANAAGSSSEVKSGKGYDPTKAAREERDRREKRHQEAMAKREEKERAACTFKPAVSRRSVELLQTVHKERPALHSPFSHRTPAKGSYKGQIAQGKPQISEVSKMLVAARDRQGPIYERLIQEGEETKRLRELAVEEHARQEASTVVGKPTIDPVSAALVQKKKDERGETVDRLSHAHVEQKKETIKRLEDEKNMQLAVEVEYKVFTNAKSKQLAKKLEATGNTSKHRMYASASGQSAAVGASQKFPDASSSPKSKGGSLSDGSPRPASAPQHRQSVSGSLSARSPSSASLRPLASTRPAADAKSSESVGASLDLITDVETLRAEFERLVAQREEAAGRAVSEMEAAVARAGEKTAKLTEEIAVLKTKNRELQLENQTLHQDKKLLLAEVETLSLRQKDSDFNEDHLNEKLKAITEKCQAVLVHNSKLQDQVNRSKVALDASGKGGAQI